MPPRSPGARARRPRRTTSPTTAPLTPNVSPWGPRVCSLAVFLVTFTVYLHTLLPTVVNQDSGELVSAAHVLGIPHPTGYPFWTLLARLFDYLPLGHTSAYRIGLLSALSVALAAAILAWLAWVAASSELGGSGGHPGSRHKPAPGALLAGLFVGFAFAFWLPTWSQAVLAEVYGLEALLFAFFLLSFWWWSEGRSSLPATDARLLLWVALSAGFVAMHHRTGGLALLPSLGAALWLTRPRRAKAWLSASLLVAAPFLFYAYLPIRAVYHPPCNWGDPDTWQRFLAHASGRQYAPWTLSNDLGAAMKEAGRLLPQCLAGPGWLSILLGSIGIPLIVWGAIRWLRRRPEVAGPLAAGSALLVIWVLGYGDTSDSKVWLVPFGATLALFGGAGIGRLAAWSPGPRYIGPVVAGMTGAAICSLLLFANWSRADRSNMWGYRDIWASVTPQVEKNAIFVGDSDASMFVIKYLQLVEGRAKDLSVLSTPTFSANWYFGSIQDAELRQAVQEVWEKASREYDLSIPNAPGTWNGVARLSYLLAQHYRGRRTVYAQHGPLVPFAGPPYFIGISDGFYRLSFDLPDMVRPARENDYPLVTLPEGIKLVSLTITPTEAGAGDLVEFRARWQLERPLAGMLFGLRLLPAQASLEPAWRRFLSKSCFQQGYPVLYGLWRINPLPAGWVYEQVGRYIIPSNAPPGDYRIEIGYAQSLPPAYDHWVPLEDRLKVRVRAKPLPTNGP